MSDKHEHKIEHPVSAKAEREAAEKAEQEHAAEVQRAKAVPAKAAVTPPPEPYKPSRTAIQASERFGSPLPTGHGQEAEKPAPGQYVAPDKLPAGMSMDEETKRAQRETGSGKP